MDLVKGGKHSVEHAIRRPFKVPPPPKVRCHWCYYHPLGFPVGPLPPKKTVLLSPSALNYILAQLYYMPLLVCRLSYLLNPLSPLWDIGNNNPSSSFPIILCNVCLTPNEFYLAEFNHHSLATAWPTRFHFARWGPGGARQPWEYFKPSNSSACDFHFWQLAFL